MKRESKIFVAGHRGLAGSAIVRGLQARGYSRLVTRTRAQLDLRDQAAVRAFFHEEQPEYVFLAAAKVGGILANAKEPATFLRDNLLIQSNVIDAAHAEGVKKLEFLASSCIYPRLCPQPMREEYLLTGPPEPTNEGYAIAKIAGVKMCESYHKQFGFPAISLAPSNLYGPGDNFDLGSSHVLPALMRKFHEAKVAGSPEVVVWGTGRARREFLHVDDMADAAIHLMLHYERPEHINVGYGDDVTIAELAQLIAEVVEYDGKITFDTSKPDGMPRKVVDVTRLHATGWKARIPLRQGIEETYQWFRSQLASGSIRLAESR